ncbi:uncharacterized protein [Panulirus ornatus]|uniref:uncharacterized protein n=1 Tax=Panulirus ornatus TaxID=150431 RepID=UPI003A89FEBD
MNMCYVVPRPPHQERILHDLPSIPSHPLHFLHVSQEAKPTDLTIHPLRSTAESIDVLRHEEPHDITASIDVESLFTNIPVERTTDIILGYVNQHHVLPPLKMSRNILREMLRACTVEASSRCPQRQTISASGWDSHGLGVVFVQAFISYVETTALRPENMRLQVYCRYIDDIFICIDNLNSLENLSNRLQETSGLRFTVEWNNYGKITFLDVMVNTTTGSFVTDAYRKPTNQGKCMNGICEYIHDYKRSVIRAYVRRMIKMCSTWQLLHQELQRVRQMLINKGYSNTEFDTIVNNMLEQTTSK